MAVAKNFSEKPSSKSPTMMDEETIPQSATEGKDYSLSFEAFSDFVSQRNGWHEGEKVNGLSDAENDYIDSLENSLAPIDTETYDGIDVDDDIAS